VDRSFQQEPRCQAELILRYSPALPLDQGLCIVNSVVRHGEHGKGEDRQGDEESSELHVRRWGERMLRWLMSGMLRGCGSYDLILERLRGEKDDDERMVSAG
jgi:hypothetical protein